MDPVDCLLRYPLFAALGRPSLQVWTEAGRATSFQVGQSLLEEGERGRHACVLLRGRVRLSRRGPDGERSLGVLPAGTVFGEYALLEPHQNTATCRACEPSEALLLPLALLRSALAALRGVTENLKAWLRLHALVHHFRHSAGLVFLTGPSLAPMLERCSEICFRPAHAVQADGLFADGWLFIQSGEVMLHVEGSEPRPLGPGDCLGEGALLGRSRLPYAVALTATTCWHLHRDHFLQPSEGAVSDSVQSLQPKLRRTWEWVAQRGPADCGVAALCMVLRGLGAGVTFEQVAPHVALGPAGATLSALAVAADRLGARPSAVRLGMDHLRNARLPAVAHLGGGHYVALFALRGDSAIVGDPESGVREEPLAAFARRWSGNLLLIGFASAPHSAN